jgi:hypothetical protein
VTGRCQQNWERWDEAENANDARLECFANTHAPGPTVSAPGKVGPKIHVVFAAQLIPWSSAYGGQDLIDSEEVTPAGEYLADAHESSRAELLRQGEAILQLGGEHVAIDKLTGRISPQFVVRRINAISVKGRTASRIADSQIVGKDLHPVQTPVFVEAELVGLIRILAAQRLGVEVGGEFQLRSSSWVKVVRSSIADHADTKGG